MGECPVGSSINVQDSFVARKARQHDVATGGKFRNALRDCSAISNYLLRLVAVPVISGQLEAGFKQPPRNRPAHVADPDKSELTCRRCNCIHTESAFGRGLADSNWVIFTAPRWRY